VTVVASGSLSDMRQISVSSESKIKGLKPYSQVKQPLSHWKQPGWTLKL